MNKADRTEYKAVLKRDNNQCYYCGSNNIHIHHIIYRSLGGANIRQNMICLCKEHHDQVHARGKEATNELIEIMRGHYGMISKEDLKIKGRYSDYAIPN
jgi:5-methylcytosine-specific restriction endonuclease McrA